MQSLKGYAIITLCAMLLCEAAEHQPRAARIPRDTHWDKLLEEHYKDRTSDTLDLSKKNVTAIPAHIQGLQNL